MWAASRRLGNLDCWIVEVCPSPSSLVSITSEEVFSCYPNPTAEILNIKTKFAAKNIVQFYNQFAQLVKEVEFNSDQTAINMLDLADGLYLVVLNGSITSSRKIILQKK